MRGLFALPVLVLCLKAYGQEGLRDRDPNLEVSRKITSELQDAFLHYGPFYLVSRLQLTDIGYDQQFFLPSDTPGGLRWAVSAPQRLYVVPTRKIVASVEVTPTLALVKRGSSRTTQFGYSGRADLQFIFNHIWFDLYTTLFNDLRAKTGEINRVVTAKERTFGMNGEFKYSSKTSATYAGSYADTRYPTTRLQPDDVINIVPLLDRKESNHRIALQHRTFPLTTFRLASELSDYEFKRTEHRNSRRTLLALGTTVNGRAWVINAEVGSGKLDFEDPTQKDFSGILGNATYSRRLGTRTTFQANAFRDIDFSVYVNNNYYTADRLGATVDYSLTRRLNLRAMAQQGRDRYHSVLVGPEYGELENTRRLDKISWYGVGWNYQRRHIQGGFDVGYYRRESNVGIDETDGIRFLLNLSLSL